MITNKITVNLFGSLYEVTLETDGQHLDGSLCIVARELDGSPFGKLTVCIKDSKLKPGEILVKTWAENEALADACLKSGLFTDTGRRVASGYVEASVWVINNLFTKE